MRLEALTTQRNVAELPSDGVVHCVTPRTWLLATGVPAVILGILDLREHVGRLEVGVRLLRVPFLARNAVLRDIHLAHVVAPVTIPAVI